MSGSAADVPVFLDRDGTLIVEKHYLGDPDQVALETGVIEGLKALQACGHPLIVVTNQSGIGQGRYTAADADRVNARAHGLLHREGIDIVAWYICPHLPADACECRKPMPGMAHAAAREWGLKLPGCYVIGDKQADVELADAIGGTGLLLTTGHGRRSLEWALSQARPVFADLRDAAAHILARESQSR